MNNQIRISDTGELETVPTTWDGEPLYSPASVQEGLFDTHAFEQIKGQTAMEEPDNSPEAVATRRAMFSGFGWGVS